MSEFFLNIINMSISASWIVLAVLLLRLLLKKAPKWIAVLLRDNSFSFCAWDYKAENIPAFSYRRTEYGTRYRP